MTTNANLRPGTLIEYKSAHSVEKAWVLEQLGRGLTDATIAIRVKGETGINTDQEFTIYVKPKGRAKVLETPADAEEAVTAAADAMPAGPFSGRALLNDLQSKADAKPRVAGSHAECSHESSKSARAACRKARAAADTN